MTVSEWLSSLFKKEQHEWFACDLTKSFSKMNNSLEKFIFFACFNSFSLLFPLLCPIMNRSHRSLLSCSLQNSDHKQIAPVALYKRATVSDFLVQSDGSDLLFFTSQSLLHSQKTSDSLEKPKSEFSTLIKDNAMFIFWLFNVCCQKQR